MKRLLKTVLAGLLLYWVIDKGSLRPELIGQALKSGLFFAAVAIIFFQLSINSLRLKLLLGMQRITVRLSYVTPLTLISMLFSFLLPGGVGGDVVKAHYLMKDHPRDKLIAGACILVDRLIGFFAMATLLCAGVLLNWSAAIDTKLLPVTWAAIALVTGFLLLPILTPVVIPRLTPILKGFFSPKFLLAIAISLCGQLGTVIFFSMAASAMGLNISIAQLLLYVPGGMILVALPVSPAGIGVGQAAFDYLFATLSEEAQLMGVTAITIIQMANLLWASVGAHFYSSRSS